MPRCYMVKKFPENDEDVEKKAPGPKSPTEATIAPTSPTYFRNTDITITMANGYINDYIPLHSQDSSVIRRTPVVTSHDGGIPIFRERSAEETEAAHDLLELSRSLPPLPNPVVVRVTPKFDDFPEKKFSKSYEETQNDSQVAYYEGPCSYKSDETEVNRSRIPVSVVVRLPSSHSETKYRDLSTFDSDKNYPAVTPYEAVSMDTFEEVTSPTCDSLNRKPDKNEDLNVVPFEEASNYNESSSSTSTEKTFPVPYSQGNTNSLVIRLPSSQPQITNLTGSSVPKKIITIPQDSSVPSHIIQFAHIISNGSHGVTEKPQSSSPVEQIYSPSGSALPSQNISLYSTQAEPVLGTNVVSYTPVIRFQPSSETLINQAKNTTEPSPVASKPPITENHSDAENSNPNSKNKIAYAKKRRTKASFLPSDWKKKKINPSEDTESPGKGKYSCTQCGRKYATSSNLSRHKQTHRSLDSQSAKKCMTCGKAYVSMPALAMHLLTHKLSHACGVCGKMFSRPWLLQGHLRSHTGEKPYRCGHCGKAFADRSNLRAHMQTHSFEKNYICLKCKKSFALKSYLSKHLESSCLKENNEIEVKSGTESPTNSMDTIDVETWSKDGDADESVRVEVETDESMDEIVVV